METKIFSTNENEIKIAAKKEIVRRYYQEMTNYKMGLVDIEVPNKIKILMNQKLQLP